MNKYKEAGIKSPTDLKVYVLYLFDNATVPLTKEMILNVLRESLEDNSMEFEHCFREVEDLELLCFDEIDGERYYTVTDKGRFVSSQLYDSIDPEFREKSLRLIMKYITLSGSGKSISASIEETPSRRFRITMEAYDRFGELATVSLTVNSRTEAEQIKKNFEAKPDAVYRGVLFAATGRLEYLS